MSLQTYTRALAADWRGPFYDGSTHELARALDAVPPNVRCGQKALGVVLQDSTGFRELRRFQTEDGYWWMWGVVFDIHGGEVLIALPWSRDLRATDGVGLDRSPAMFVGGRASLSDAIAAAGRVTRALRA
jgi:hypothetical protein